MSNHGHGTVLDLSLKDRSQLHILSHNQQPYITMVVGLHYLSCIDVIKVHIGDYNNHRGLTRWADGSVLWQQYKAGKLQPLHSTIASNYSPAMKRSCFQLLGASSTSTVFRKVMVLALLSLSRKDDSTIFRFLQPSIDK